MMPTKIRLFSDIHWEFDMKENMSGRTEPYFWSPVPMVDDRETILILAGDLWNGLKSIDEIQTFHHRFRMVFVVLGNHDYYNELIDSFDDEYKQELINRNMENVFLLDKDTIEVDGKLFVGASLFTNMDNYSPKCIADAPNCMVPDFRYIKKSEQFDEHYMKRTVRISSQDWLDRNTKDFTYIKNVVENNKDKDVIVLSHYGCSRNSIHHRFLTYGHANYYFVNDYEDFINKNENIKYWFHGHVHDNMQYKIGNCQVKTNPRAYPRENYHFDEYSLYEV